MKDKRPDLYDLYEDDYDKSVASVRGTKGLITRRQAVMGGTLGLAALGLTAYGFFRPQVGSDGVIRVPYTVQNRGATPVATTDAGEPVYQPPKDDVGDKMPVLDDNTLYAPKPEVEVHAAVCEVDAAKVTSDVPANLPAFGWSIPTQGISSSLSASGSTSGRMVLPITADGSGIWYSKSNPITASEGSTILAGHVNRRSYYLSPWGYLHQLSGCERLFLTDGNGHVTQWHVTDMFTVPQDKLTEVQGMWDKTGDRSLWLVTCSGQQVGSDGATGGNTFGFNYRYNLVVRCAPNT